MEDLLHQLPVIVSAPPFYLELYFLFILVQIQVKIQMNLQMKIQIQIEILIQIQILIKIQKQIQIQLPHFETLEKGEAEVEEYGEDESPPAQNIGWSLTIKRSFDQTKILLLKKSRQHRLSILLWYSLKSVQKYIE